MASTKKDDRGITMEEGEEKKAMNLDTILVNEIGQIGWFQLRIMGLAISMAIFAAWAAAEFNFTTARIPTRCLIPECETEESFDFRASWVLNAIPQAGNSFDQCRRYRNISSTITRQDNCPAEWFNSDSIKDCEVHLYENTDTVVHTFGLACDEWRRTLIGSIRTLGTLVALPITGYISDRWGRRTALSINGFTTAWMGIVRYWSNTYVGFLISEVVESMFSGGFSCAYIILMELMGPKYRVAAGASLNTSFSIGLVLLGFIAWGVPDWRNLTLALYIPQLLTFSYFFLMAESVRWYMSKGRFEEAEKVLKNAARVNKKELSEKSLELLREHALEEERKKADELARSEPEPWLVVLVFRHKRILVRCMVSPVWWITTTFIYYGMSINAVNMSGNRYLNYVAVSAVEIPGYWAAVVLMARIGRKPVLICAFWVCCACQIGYIFIPSDQYAASLSLYLVGKFSIAMVMTSIYVYTSELYPTKYRHSLFAFSSMIGRIGSIVAPLTPAFGAAVWDDLPFALFAGFAFISGLLVLVTPETLGTKLPDTMEEASNLGLKKTDP
ncbi:organic cation transporter protein-like [Pararge aegeria]|uniref:Jg15622 protein n=1 Tax=Pararge aegeria aegeria TaxID=348720 RepID=A0A8S4RU46_9NEOP|nr:organic cation transporter protein-like [Pararge aegeria]CAH2241425.1 jg15622 [Pararge aegeria aegeria]